MRPQAHTAASLAIWSAGNGGIAEAAACALAGNLPDLDRTVARLAGSSRRDHHRWVSHSLVGWLLPSAAALRAARGSRRAAAARRCVLALWVHLLMDTYADGIAWLWPLRRDKLGLFRKPAWIRDRGWRTPAPPGTNLGRIEAVLWATVAVNVLRRG